LLLWSIRISVLCAGEARFGIRDSREIECQLELWHEDGNLGERLDVSHAAESLGGEIRAVREVENRLFLRDCV
jgi:hypothetical protein